MDEWQTKKRKMLAEWNSSSRRLEHLNEMAFFATREWLDECHESDDYFVVCSDNYSEGFRRGYAMAKWGVHPILLERSARRRRK